MAFRATAPLWTLPGQPGLLSNKYASPETFGVRYASTGGNGDPIGNLRVTAQRVADGTTLWDSGVIGRLTTTAPPTGGTPSAFGGQLLVGTAGGLAIPGGNFGGTASDDLLSSPTLGGTNGTWSRQVNALAPYVTAGNQYLGFPPSRTGHRTVAVPFNSATTYVYAIGGGDGVGSNTTLFNSTVGVAVLNPDGTTGPWMATTPVPWFNLVSLTGLGVAAMKTGSNWYLYVTGGYDGTSMYNQTWWALVNADGTVSAWNVGPNLPANLYGHVCVAFGGQLHCIGGAQTFGGTPQTTIYRAPINSDGSIGAWTTPGVPISTAVRQAACVLALAPGGIFLNVVLLGGNNGTSNVTTTQYVQISNQGGLFGGTTLAAAPQSGSDGGAGVTLVGTSAYSMYYLQGSAVLYSAPLTFSGGIPVIGTWSHGQGSTALQTSDLGTGGAIVANGDGTQDLTFGYGRFGPSATNPAAGDAVIFTAQTAGNASGTPSALGSTSVSFGDPPTVTTVAQDGNGSPTITFVFVQGNGGGPEQQWQVQLLDGSSNMLADSGLVFGSANRYTANAPNPRLLNGASFTARVLNVSTTDVPYPGSTDTAAVVNLAFTGNGLFAPVFAPTLTATADNANGAVNLAITNLAPPAAPTSSSAPAPTHDASSTSSLTTGNPYWVAVAFVDAALNVSPAYMAGSVTLTGAGQKVLEAVTVPGGAGISYVGVYLAKAASQPAFSSMRIFAIVNVTTGAVTYAATNASGVAGSVVGSVVTVTMSAVDNGTGSSPATASTMNYAITNRVYYRLSGTTPWVLLKNVPTGFTPGSTPSNTSGPNPPGGVVNVALYDQLVLGQAYDFSVSSVAFQLNAESAQSAPASATIVLQGYTAVLHVAGNGAVQHVGLLEVPSKRSVKEFLDNPLNLMFADVAPSSRSGPADFVEVDTEVVLLGLADYSALQSVLGAARAGSVLYWRDTLGGMYPCAASNISGSTNSADRQFDVVGVGYRRTAKLMLTQIRFAYAP